MRQDYSISGGRVAEVSGERIRVYTAPTPEEKAELLAYCGVDDHTLSSMLDPEEVPRVEVEGDHTIIIWKRPDPASFRTAGLFEVSSVGGPINATGLRIKVPDANSDIDEIEVNTAATAPRPQLTIAKSGNDAVITWAYGGGLECATSLTGPWACVGDALPTGYTVPLNSSPTRFYRVRR